MSQINTFVNCFVRAACFQNYDCCDISSCLSCCVTMVTWICNVSRLNKQLANIVWEGCVQLKSLLTRAGSRDSDTTVCFQQLDFEAGSEAEEEEEEEKGPLRQPSLISRSDVYKVRDLERQLSEPADLEVEFSSCMSLSRDLTRFCFVVWFSYYCSWCDSSLGFCVEFLPGWFVSI